MRVEAVDCGPEREGVTWHACEAGEAARRFGVDPSKGLAGQDAADRLDKWGPNEIAAEKRRTVFQMFADQLKEFLVILLLVSAAISGLLGEMKDAIIIIGIVLLNAVLGVVQESRAESALAALKRMSKPRARVLRDGRPAVIAASELVPGDVFLLEAGDFVPADGRLVESASLKVEESSLTGESVPVEKQAEAVVAEDAPLGDRINMVFSGTSVTYGRGKAIATATGMRTEIGRIAQLISEAEESTTPLQERLDYLGKRLGVAAIALCVLVFVEGILRNQPPFDMFMTSVSLAVAAIPEGLPAIVTVVLALGVQRMAAQRAVIRRLPAVETLGSATVICSDKTGTLTKNEMTVTHVVTMLESVSVTGTGYSVEGGLVKDGAAATPEDVPVVAETLRVGALCSDARLRAEGGIVGDPTEGAIVVAAAKIGADKAALERRHPRVAEVPFDSVRKRMSTANKDEEGYLICVKGAPEEVLDVCTHYMTVKGVQPLDAGARARMLDINGDLAAEGLRVLAVAERRMDALPSDISADTLEQGLAFLGLLGMVDPPRPEVRESVKQARSAGIIPIMITGDHRTTAVAIAKALGMMDPDDEAVTGRELDAMSDEELDARVERIKVYARTSPEHKMKIVSSLQRKGHIVAMTGDGVNDAPALKKADIGAAMGITGTDVAKGAADMVLTDDNFATIVAAVREGRIIFENIKKTVSYLLSCNIGEIVAIGAAIGLGLPRPLLPAQILWVNLVTDGLPALALGVEPVHPDIMKAPPKGSREKVLSGGALIRLVLFGVWVGLLTLGAFLWRYSAAAAAGCDQAAGAGVDTARTMAMVALSFSQLFHSFNNRSETRSVFSLGLRGNPKLVWAFVISGGLQVALVAVPSLRRLFNTTSLTLAEWGISLAFAASIVVVSEIVKAALRAQKKM